MYTSSKSDSRPEVVVNTGSAYSVFTDPIVGLSFEYKTAPDGYVVDDPSSFIGEDEPSVIKVFRVINEREKIELETSEGGREGPPTVSIMVFKNDLKQTASQWVDSVPRFSNIQFAIGDVDRDAVVAGANAVRYRTDGLYLSENAVVAHGDYVYHFAGAFLEEEAVIYQDFMNLLESITFLPTDSMVEERGAPAKLDPRVACESALAYMTFESGVAADLFVAACVAGEHPEVIERYIIDMGLNGASI